VCWCRSRSGRGRGRGRDHGIRMSLTIVNACADNYAVLADALG